MDTKKWNKDVGELVAVASTTQRVLDEYERLLAEGPVVLPGEARSKLAEGVEKMRETLKEQRARLTRREAYLDAPVGAVYRLYAKKQGSAYPVVEFEARGALVELRKLDGRGQVRSSTVVGVEEGRELWGLLQKGYGSERAAS